MLIAAIAIVVTAVCSMLLFYQILEKQIFDDLAANAHVIARNSAVTGDMIWNRMGFGSQSLKRMEWFYLTVWKMRPPWKTIRTAPR